MKALNFMILFGVGIILGACTKSEISSSPTSIDDTDLTERGTDCCCTITFTAGSGTMKLCSNAFTGEDLCGEACYTNFKSKMISVISTDPPHSTTFCNAKLKTYYLKIISGGVSGRIRCSGTYNFLDFSLNSTSPTGNSIAFIPNQSCVQELTSCD